MKMEATNNMLAGLMTRLAETTWLYIAIAATCIIALAIVIIINQVRIRKQLRQIQEQLEQKDKPEE